MEYLTAIALTVFLLLPLWALIASPLLIAGYLAARTMRRRRVSSLLASAGVALTFTLLAAPVPTPIITILVPHALAVFDPNYYPIMGSGSKFFWDLIGWIGSSLVVTFTAAYIFLRRYTNPATSLVPPSQT